MPSRGSFKGSGVQADDPGEIYAKVGGVGDSGFLNKCTIRLNPKP